MGAITRYIATLDPADDNRLAVHAIYAGCTPVALADRPNIQDLEVADRMAEGLGFIRTEPWRTDEQGIRHVDVAPIATHRACIALTRVNGRRLADYGDLRNDPQHGHRTPDDIVGYVVRQTIADDGLHLWKGQAARRPSGVVDHPEGCGIDVLAIEGAIRFHETIATREHLRRHGGYAVTDVLYACGCRG